MTIGHPAAIAGPILKAKFNNGKFHATIAPTTPTGSSTIVCECEPSESGIISDFLFRISSE